jgi:hypothetical protein
MTSDPVDYKFEIDRSIKLNEFKVELPEMTDVNGNFDSFRLESETLGVYSNSTTDKINTFESSFVELELKETSFSIKFSIPESEYENFAGEHEILIMLKDDTGLSRNYTQSVNFFF